MAGKKGKSGGYDESERSADNRNVVPVLAPEIGTRIGKVADLVGGRRQGAEAAGVSIASLQRYIAEEVEPTFSAIAGLAKAGKVRLDWLAFDEQPMLKDQSLPVAPLDLKLLEDIIFEVEDYLQELGGTIESKKKAELLSLIYEDVREQEGKVDRARIIRFVNLAA